MNRVLLSCFLLILSNVFAEGENNIPTHLFGITYSGSAGNSEISSKTSYSNRIGATYSLQIKRFSLGVEYQFMFSNYSGADLFGALRTSEGMIISDNGELIDLQTLFRGNSAYLTFGKHFMISPHNTFQINLGLGFLEHHLSIKTLDGSNAYFSKSILRGYDQLSAGPATKQQFRINHFGAKKRINCYIELFAEEAFLQNLRKYNYFDNSVDTKTHFNFIAGIQVGWLIPLFNTEPEEEF